MTGTDGQVSPGDPTAGPLTPELLADLHAGVLDEQVATPLRLRVAADAQARTVLAALDATVAELGALPQQRTAPMPDAVANRLDAALAAEAARASRLPVDPPPDTRVGVAQVPPMPVADLAARRRRRTGWAGIGILAAVAAAIGVVALSGVQLDTAGTPRGGDALGNATRVQPSEPFALTSGNLGGALDQALKARDYGPLTPPPMLQNCLAANGVAGGGAPLGALEVTLNGRRGVLLVLPTGQIAQVRLLVVGPSCSPGNPSELAEYVLRR
ncbi:MAG: hypothetical protein ACRDSL_16960 [Pseudonocardiaceae bacterium]